MRPEHHYFDVSPVVVPADTLATIVIRPLHGHVALRDDAACEVAYYPCEEYAQRSGWPAKNKPPVRRTEGALEIEQYFEGEQEHVLILDVVQGESRRRLGEFRVYSVESELVGRYPFKGDLHMHSSYSDGRESPAYVAAACRSIGLDFMAVTDHRRYAPSLEAIAAFEGVPCDLRIYAGEEVHPPDNPVHIINFGGRRSINEMFADEPSYRASVDELGQKIGPVPPGVDAYQYASTVWCFDRIREVGGLGVFCHPYWFTDNRYTPSGALTSYLFQTQPFDAYEVIGGYHLFEAASNTLQVARYHEERAKGRRIPIVGVSDSHGCERGQLFGWYYTVAFSPTCDLSDLVASIKDLWSVAVEALPNQEARPFGPFRLVKYAQFLMREVFPLHDELCVEEGRLMRAHAAGDATARASLKGLQGRTASLYRRLFGRD